MGTRRKPHDPASAQRAALEPKDRDAEAQRMVAQGATVKRDRAGNIISAWRSNVFTLLLQRGTISLSQHDAYERLRDVWCAWKGLEGRPESSEEFVDCKGSPAEGRALVTDRMVRAGKDVAWVMRQLNPVSQRIMAAFMVAIVEEDRPMHWRGVIERVTGETVRDRQPPLVVAALEEVRMVFHEPRERAA